MSDGSNWVFTTINGWGVRCRACDVEAITESLTRELAPGGIIALPAGAELFPPPKRNNVRQDCINLLAVRVDAAKTVIDYAKSGKWIVNSKMHMKAMDAALNFLATTLNSEPKSSD